MNETTKIGVFVIVAFVVGSIFTGLAFETSMSREIVVEAPEPVVITKTVVVYNGKNLPHCPLVVEGTPCVDLRGAIYPAGWNF